MNDLGKVEYKPIHNYGVQHMYCCIIIEPSNNSMDFKLQQPHIQSMITYDDQL